MITGVHAIIYSPEADAARAFLRDIAGFASIDSGGGWPIFALPPAELAVHPSDAASHELFFLCDDIHATIRDLRAKGADVDETVSEERWGLLSHIRLPGGVQIGLYEPRHPLAIGSAR
jgi:hypothetical protein